jgi:tetratricopeptide (TPR) repeat protein
MGDRFGMLPLTKKQALKELQAEIEFRGIARQRWLAWLTCYVQEYGGEDWDWRGYKRVGLEIDNILTMIDQGLENEWSESLVALRFVTFYMKISGRWAESNRQSLTGLILAQKLGDNRAIGLLGTHSLGWTLGQLGELVEAEKFARGGLQAYVKLGDQREVASAKRVLGQILRKQKRFKEAKELYQEALTIAREKNDTGLEGNLIGELGKLARDQNNRATAWSLLTQATDILADREVDKPVYASLLEHMARMRYEDGDLATAKRLCKRCLDIFDEIGGVTDALLTLAQVYAAEGSIKEAEIMAQRAFDLYQHLGIKESLVQAEALLFRLRDRTRNN